MVGEGSMNERGHLSKRRPRTWAPGSRSIRPSMNQKPASQSASASPKTVERPIEAEGVYSNERFVHAVTSIIGCTTQVLTSSGSLYEGILRAFSPKFEVCLEMAHLVDPKKPEDVDKSKLVNTLLLSPQDIVHISAKNASLDYATKGIRFNGEICERELEPWEGPSIDGDDLQLENDPNGWDAQDMFRTNEENFNVKSTYEPTMREYTVAIHQNDSDEFRWREKEAQRLASEIEQNPTSRTRGEVENGDDEDRFSAVVRPSGSPNQGGGKYVPPQRRRGAPNNSSRPVVPRHQQQQQAPQQQHPVSPPVAQQAATHQPNTSTYAHPFPNANTTHMANDAGKPYEPEDDIKESTNMEKATKGPEGALPQRTDAADRRSERARERNRDRVEKDKEKEPPEPGKKLQPAEKKGSPTSSKVHTPVAGDPKVTELKKFQQEFQLVVPHSAGASTGMIPESHQSPVPLDEMPEQKMKPMDSPPDGSNVSTPIGLDPGEEEKGGGGVKKSTLNPNAKEFVLNPNAKAFTPRSPSTSTPPQVLTPQIPQGIQAPAALIPAAFPPQQSFPGAPGHPLGGGPPPPLPSYILPALQQYVVSVGPHLAGGVSAGIPNHSMGMAHHQTQPIFTHAVTKPPRFNKMGGSGGPGGGGGVGGGSINMGGGGGMVQARSSDITPQVAAATGQPLLAPAAAAALSPHLAHLYQGALSHTQAYPPQLYMMTTPQGTIPVMQAPAGAHNFSSSDSGGLGPPVSVAGMHPMFMPTQHIPPTQTPPGTGVQAGPGGGGGGQQQGQSTTPRATPGPPPMQGPTSLVYPPTTLSPGHVLLFPTPGPFSQGGGGGGLGGSGAGGPPGQGPHHPMLMSQGMVSSPMQIQPMFIQHPQAIEEWYKPLPPCEMMEFGGSGGDPCRECTSSTSPPVLPNQNILWPPPAPGSFLISHLPYLLKQGRNPARPFVNHLRSPFLYNSPQT
ncbi:unnamed protein product [Darwinula stevensoni]|uniref:LsmAD domain-containing protein n=1 Tax=Darwinula stevensoni TaxID=69355 RepID=A0A7R9A3Y9_9CRUS|nr:unnamed protein product [Darwinula stevensoni]CAG0883157.1 unnamed protein product [Darwinula stevensoni]